MDEKKKAVKVEVCEQELEQILYDLTAELSDQGYLYNRKPWPEEPTYEDFCEIFTEGNDPRPDGYHRQTRINPPHGRYGGRLGFYYSDGELTVRVRDNLEPVPDDIFEGAYSTVYNFFLSKNMKLPRQSK